LTFDAPSAFESDALGKVSFEPFGEILVADEVAPRRREEEETGCQSKRCRTMH
jgi:hypothetical protein